MIGNDQVDFGAFFQSERDEGSRTGISAGGIQWEAVATTPPVPLPKYNDQIHPLKATINPSTAVTRQGNFLYGLKSFWQA